MDIIIATGKSILLWIALGLPAWIIVKLWIKVVDDHIDDITNGE